MRAKGTYYVPSMYPSIGHFVGKKADHVWSVWSSANLPLTLAHVRDFMSKGYIKVHGYIETKRATIHTQKMTPGGRHGRQIEIEP
ncbi:MAG: hypothetical protein BMS9Abin05_2279 [Rhodothermia bacterium]|nr:MAG: hypothetical protein BMS9Abin05_2279 [Rhodothermia bacterium]